MTNVQIHPPFHVPHVLRLGKTEKAAQIFVIYPFLHENNILNHNRIERRWFAKYYLASTYTSFSFASSSYVKSIWFHNYTSSNYFYLIKINQLVPSSRRLKIDQNGSIPIFIMTEEERSFYLYQPFQMNKSWNWRLDHLSLSSGPNRWTKTRSSYTQLLYLSKDCSVSSHQPSVVPSIYWRKYHLNLLEDLVWSHTFLSLV